MTLPELLAALASAGCTLTADSPEPGRIACAPGWPAELKAAAVEHKAALLQYLRDAKNVTALGERLEAKAETFPFGNNNPADPDGEADALLQRIRDGGNNIEVDPADRTKLRLTPSIDKWPADVLADVRRLKPALLALLEKEARAEELSSTPTPFRGPGLDAGDVVQGGSNAQADGLAGGAGNVGPGHPRPHEPAEAGDSGARAEATGGEAGQGGAEATATARHWVGWVKADKASPWLQQCRDDDWASCWTRLLPLARESSSRELQATVLQEGRTP